MAGSSGAMAERDRLAQSVFRALTADLESGRPFTWEAAAARTIGLLLRSGQARSKHERANLVDAVEKLAAVMPAPTEAGVLEAFSDASVAALPWNRGADRHPGAVLATHRDRPRSNRKLAEAALYAEYNRATSDEDLVHRAVTRALRERRRERAGQRHVSATERHPVRDLLDLPAQGPARVPRGDVRLPLAKQFGRLLEQAAPFSEAVVRPALGEELWARCRPLGWADSRQTRLLVEVPSAARAHELTMQRSEILRRLRAVPGFERLKDLRFQVRAAPPS